MYQPGDYVVGYPDFYESNGKRYIRKPKFDSRSGDIRCHENKEALLWDQYTADRFRRQWAGERGLENRPRGFEYLHYTELQGMVVAVDELNEARPHWDGVVQVLVGEKILWVWARNLRLVKYAGGKP